MINHTPTPWRVEVMPLHGSDPDGMQVIYVVGQPTKLEPEGAYIADCGTLADAEHIARAVNAYDATLEVQA